MTKTFFASAISALLVSTACGDGAPSGPSPSPPPVGSNFAVFTDAATGFSTTDVRDVDEQIMRFELDSGTLIWTEQNLAFDGWLVEGNFLGEGRLYQVRFGTVSGERRAYFTETGPGTLCDLDVEAGFLRISPTNQLPPSS